MNWYSLIYNSETRTAHVILRDDIGCGGLTSGDLQNELVKLCPKNIELQIDSTGGCSITGLNLHGIFRQYETDVIITGHCYSAALTVAMAGRKIRIARGAKILIHSPSGYVHGTADKLFDGAIEIESLKHSVAAILCDRTRQSAHVVLEWLSRDTWLTADEALALGLADELFEAPAPKVKTDLATGEITIPDSAKIPGTEKLFGEWLTAFGQVEVFNRKKFINALIEWANLHTYEKTDA